MAARRAMSDEWYDRAEAHGQALEAVGRDVTGAWYPEWGGPDATDLASFITAGKALLAAVDSVILLLPVVEGLSAGSSPAPGREAA